MVESGPHEGTQLAAGAVDLYVHAAPDLVPRQGDDVELARTLSAGGLRAAVHRHHFSPTVDRAALATAVTGFPLFGAVLCNDSIGGINPAAVELGLEYGAVWIGLPTLSARAQRARAGSYGGEFSKALGFGPGDLVLRAIDGSVLPEVMAILDLARDHDAAINIGYADFDDCLAVAHAAKRIGLSHLVITNPMLTMRFTETQVDRLMDLAPLIIEQTCYSMHTSGSFGGGQQLVDAAAELIRRYGVDRVVLSSDGGVAGAPPPPELLAWGCQALLARGIGRSDVERLVAQTPARVIGLA